MFLEHKSNTFYPIPSKLERMGCPIFCIWGWLGLPSFGENFYPWLDLFPLKEKGNKIMAGNSPMLVMRDLEGEELSNL